LVDDYLYIGTGDGGSGGDPDENAQDPGSLLGKILRIDVQGSVEPYTIPVTNPYTQTSGYRGEIWALGLRNPWRFSFDRETGDLFIGDVGQNRIRR
jgi:glucose/arabinose dehydrogenase